MSTGILTDRIGFAASEGMISKIHSAAEREDMTASEYLRHAVRSQLRMTEREQKAVARWISPAK